MALIRLQYRGDRVHEVASLWAQHLGSLGPYGWSQLLGKTEEKALELGMAMTLLAVPDEVFPHPQRATVSVSEPGVVEFTTPGGVSVAIALDGSTLTVDFGRESQYLATEMILSLWDRRDLPGTVVGVIADGREIYGAFGAVYFDLLCAATAQKASEEPDTEPRIP